MARLGKGGEARGPRSAEGGCGWHGEEGEKTRVTRRRPSPSLSKAPFSLAFKGALHRSRNERDGRRVMGRTIPDLKLSLQLRRHVGIELGYVDPRIVRRWRPLPGVSRTCAVMINSLENPIHTNLPEELRKRPVGSGSSEHAQQPSFLPHYWSADRANRLRSYGSDRSGSGSSEHAQQRSFLPLGCTLCIGRKLRHSS